ncbi:flavin reductase [Anderseniella sp. Alg231-50]|uniref:flavin reductase n=1 Tax=Anderseniella sp. Alg231-50 TaxID=1922226 RepID=UPI00307BE825
MTGLPDKKLLRAALSQFATGVTIIATKEEDGTPRGFTANSFTSVSLDPPLILVCIARSAASCDVFSGARHFSVNVLAEEQKDISGLFASQRPDKFDIAPWHPGQTGTPLIDDALAWFECAHHDMVDAGDHVILVGRVLDFGQGRGRPLGYFRGAYFTLGLEDPLVDAVARNTSTIIGAVYEQSGSILLEVHPDTGDLAVPTVGSTTASANLTALKQKYDETQLSTAIEFVYAVFEDNRTGRVTIYYRGQASGPAPAGTQFFAFDDIPFDRIRDSAMRDMLERYVSEARQGGFAIYMGDEIDGVVRPVG